MTTRFPLHNKLVEVWEFIHVKLTVKYEFMKINIYKLVILFGLTIYSLYQFATNDAFAAQCIGIIPLDYQIERADVVVMGRAENVDSSYTTIVVERYYKGHGGPSKIRVTGRESPGANWITSSDFGFEQGKKYLLFLKNHYSGVLRTTLCTGNKIIDGSLNSEDIAVLGSGYSPTSSENLKISSKLEWLVNNSWMPYASVGLGGTAVLGALFFVLKKSKHKKT